MEVRVDIDCDDIFREIESDIDRLISDAIDNVDLSDLEMNVNDHDNRIETIEEETKVIEMRLTELEELKEFLPLLRAFKALCSPPAKPSEPEFEILT